MPASLSDVHWVVWVYLGMSVVTFAVYGRDKGRAKRGGQRVSEASLHLLELGGGWPGAFVGQRVFRHKTSKRSFQFVFWLIGVLHAAFWFVWLGRP